MKETMMQYIKETPEQFQYNVENSKELTRTIVDEFCKKEYKKIQIIASGSSYNGGYTAKYFMEKILGIKVELVTSFTVLNYETIFDSDTFYIGMGQSGRSTNTNAAMRKIKNLGYPIVGVTGNVDSEMKNNCTAICNWGMGVEKIGYVTKGYSTSVLFYMLFALNAALKKQTISIGDYTSYTHNLIEMTDHMKNMIEIAQDWYLANEKELYNQLGRIQITGYGPGHGCAMEGALKIEETIAVASTAYEMEEYLHGPFYETDERRTVIVIDTGAESSERASKLFQSLPTLTPSTFLITNKESDNPRVVGVQHELDETMSSIISVIPLQIIAALGKDKWGNPYEDKYNAFGELMNTKSPRKGDEVGL